MKIFAIIDELDNDKKELAHLFYFEKAKRFYIEIPDDAEYWKTPLILDSYLKKGVYTVDSVASLDWVRNRIVPINRQNIGLILKDCCLREYDEFKLLTISTGRCAQDDYYIKEITKEKGLSLYSNRLLKHIDMALPLKDYSLLIYFNDDSMKKCDIKTLQKDDRYFTRVINDIEIFNSVMIQPGGYGVCWSEDLNIPCDKLYECGISVPLSKDDMLNIFKTQIITTAEASVILNSSRQYINELTTKGQIIPIKQTAKSTLHLMDDVERKLW